jgi:anti-sigma factor RsiW
MDHSEAVKQMAAEKYLLNELPPDARDAFEEHFFDCPDCALDLRAGAAFVNEAKTQLPELTASQPARSALAPSKAKEKRSGWLSWWSPAIAAPAFATLLLFIGYQNLVTYPALRESADQPRILPVVPAHGATRGAQIPVSADRKHGVAFPIDLAPRPGIASYVVDLYDSQGKIVWTGTVAAPAKTEGQGQLVSLDIPGAMLHTGAYTVAVNGVSLQGDHTVLDRIAFDVHVTE